MMRQDPTDLRGRTRPFLLPLLLLLVAGLLAPWPAAAEAAAGAGSSGSSAMSASVVSSSDAMLELFSSAVRETLAGSTTPALTKSS